MPDGPGPESAKNRSFPQRLFLLSIAGVLFAFLVYFSAFFLQKYFTFPRMPFGTRLPLLFFAALPLAFASWVVLEALKLQARDEAAKAGRDFEMPASLTFWTQVGDWIIPVTMTLLPIVMAASLFTLASLISGRPQLGQFRQMLWAMTAVFVLLALIWPYKLIRRKLKTGSYMTRKERLGTNGSQPIRKRILVASVYCLIAASETFSALQTQHDHVFAWAVAAFMWAGATFFVWDAIRPHNQAAIDHEPSGTRPAGV